MNTDPHERRIARLFDELREEDRQEAPPFTALASPLPLRHASPARPIPRHWALAASLLATGTAVLLINLAFLGPQPPASTESASQDWWSFPTDSLLSGTDSFGSLETWQSPTDSLFDFSPTNT